MRKEVLEIMSLVYLPTERVQGRPKGPTLQTLVWILFACYKWVMMCLTCPGN